jgi:hypothetical protein
MEETMRSCQTKILLGAAFMLLANAGLSYGDAVIVSNLTDPADGTGTIYSSGPPQWYAQEFLTGSSSEVLSSIIVPLGDASGSFTAGAELVNNNSGLPGSTVLTSFTVPMIPTGSPTDLTFTPMQSVTLAANTDYWFILAATGSGGHYEWEYTDTLSPSFPNYAVSNTSGTAWAIGTPPGPFLLEANAAAVSAVPEPSSLVLVTCGFLTLAVVLIRRRRKVVQG